MCGIAGIVTSRPDSLNVAGHLLDMSKILRHRGPDDEGFFLSAENKIRFYSGHDTPAEVVQSNLKYTAEEKLQTTDHGYRLGFCHRRLSILDLSPKGHQPMCDAEQKLIITYNGEIYNYIELREELRSKGFRFFTDTDTEVILNAYKAWGLDCMNRFNGMWSFVLYDREKNELIGARDRFGVKPFYYYHDEVNFCFASEQKALVKMPFIKTSVNEKALYDFLVNHEIEYEPEGFFKNIIELFPGKCLRFNLSTNQLAEQTYYTLSVNTGFSPFDQNEFEAAKLKTEKLLVEAVKLRLRADVSVGSCLSGGIDSSVIAGIMQQISGENIPEFFTATFPSSDIDESVWAKEVIMQSGNWHTVTPAADELWRDLNDLVYSQDIPIWSSSTYSQFSVMKLAKENNVKVLLDGQGGDELFGGYIPYYLSYWNELKRNRENAQLKKEIRLFDAIGNAKKYLLKENIKSVINKTQSVWAKSIINRDLHFINRDFIADHFTSHCQSKQGSSLNEQLKSEFCNTRLKLYLKCEDRCSMWHSVESRTPFADDVSLIEYVFGLPGTFKIHDGNLKFLLRQAARNYLPDKIFSRKDKMGYVTPHNDWLRQIYPLVSQEDFTPLAPFVNIDRLRKNFETIYSPKGSNERFFGFKLLMLLRWKSLFNV